MTDKLDEYRQAHNPLPDSHLLWPLYGVGMENLGQDGEPIQVPVPDYGPDELLVRHDAVGLCFSDIKVIQSGESHPRIHRQMKADPVVLGHEISMTIVGVGENLRDAYRVGDRFTIQADIYLGGVSYAYGYEIQGGLSQYSVLDWRVLNGDHGNYLLPLQPSTGYAESALTEPWACVTAAYQLTYRTGLKPGGTAWMIGARPEAGMSYTISEGLEPGSHPDRLLLTEVPPAFEAWLREEAQRLGIECLEVGRGAAPPVEQVDDIVLLGADSQVIEAVSPYLADFGVVALIDRNPLDRPVAVDIGRVHYHRWVYVGGPGPDIARAYDRMPVRSTLRPGGRAWFVGAGGPMGRMHVQRAIQLPNGPKTMVCTDVSDHRLADLQASYGPEAAAKGIEFICLNPTEPSAYEAGLARFQEQGFDDIIVLAPITSVITEAAPLLAPGGVMNVFAGLARGSMAELDLSDAYLKDTRIIGHSASTIEDLRQMLQQAESGQLSPNRSVAAVGSLKAARDGLQAVKGADFPGKVVIFPQIKDFPLTALPDLRDRLPEVYARLDSGREWTVAAEEEFLRQLLV